MTFTLHRSALSALGLPLCLAAVAVLFPPAHAQPLALARAVRADPIGSDSFVAPSFTKGSLNQFTFPMVRSTAVQTAGTSCLPNATATITITRHNQNDVMAVRVAGVQPGTDFDLFVLQIPDKPFGVAWYQSDLDTDATGTGSVLVQGIFNAETFSLSQGGVAGGSAVGSATAVTSTNVTFQPTNQYHLGLWFATPADAQKNGCPTTVTPFNGEQNAGIQALSTRNFAAGLGPIAAIRP
jgi:hypothetical protein